MNNQEKLLHEKKIKEKKIIKEKDVENILTSMNEQIYQLQSTLLNNEKKMHDIELRALANIENIKKNSKDKIKEIKNIKTEQFLKKIIPIIDSIENILHYSNESNIHNTPVIRGIELTFQSLCNVLKKTNIIILGKKNEIFDPKIHNVISVQSSNKYPPNHIILVHKKGFILNNIVLKKAIVTISKK